MINKELLDYIYASIFPEYEKNDAGHRFDHIIYVIERSLAFADRCNKCYPDKEPIDNNMVYVIAAYHDIGHHIDHLNHEAVSAEIMACDKNLTKWFTPEQIEIMRVAIAEHRSCLEGEPTTIYGKIVSSADRNVDMTSIYKRCYEYRRVHNPEMTNDELAEEAYCHVRDKFGVGGYATEKMFFDDPEYDAFLAHVEMILKDKAAFKREFYEANGLGVLNLRQQIENFFPINEQEIVDKAAMLNFIDSFDDVVTRNNTFGHFTASAFVVDEYATQALMLHHKIMGDYIYPGGHADGEYDLLSVAQREVKEETGLNVIPMFDGEIFAIQAAPVKGHVKNGKYISAHVHYDVLFVFKANKEEMDKIRILESENTAVEWWPICDTFTRDCVVDWARDVNRKIVKKFDL